MIAIKFEMEDLLIHAMWIDSEKTPGDSHGENSWYVVLQDQVNQTERAIRLTPDEMAAMMWLSVSGNDNPNDPEAGDAIGKFYDLLEPKLKGLPQELRPIP